MYSHSNFIISMVGFGLFVIIVFHMLIGWVYLVEWIVNKVNSIKKRHPKKKP